MIEMLQAWDFNIDVYKAAVKWGDENPDANTNATALWWLSSNEDIWGAWVTSEAAESISIALAAGKPRTAGLASRGRIAARLSGNG